MIIHRPAVNGSEALVQAIDEGPNCSDFFESHVNFSHLVTSNPYDNVSPDLIIQLDYAGAGGETLLIHPESSRRMTDLFRETGLALGVEIENRVDSPDFTTDIITRDFEWLSLRWSDAQISPLDDTLETIDPAKVDSLGKILTLTLVNLVRETDY